LAFGVGCDLAFNSGVGVGSAFGVGCGCGVGSAVGVDSDLTFNCGGHCGVARAGTPSIALFQVSRYWIRFRSGLGKEEEGEFTRLLIGNKISRCSIARSGKVQHGSIVHWYFDNCGSTITL
jgi:hypothetical protein